MHARAEGLGALLQCLRGTLPEKNHTVITRTLTHKCRSRPPLTSSPASGYP